MICTKIPQSKTFHTLRVSSIHGQAFERYSLFLCAFKVHIVIRVLMVCFWGLSQLTKLYAWRVLQRNANQHKCLVIISSMFWFLCVCVSKAYTTQLHRHEGSHSHWCCLDITPPPPPISLQSKSVYFLESGFDQVCICTCFSSLVLYRRPWRAPTAGKVL